MRIVAVLLLGVTAIGCHTLSPGRSRYVVTTTPLALLQRHPGFCVAVDPADPHGVWWWEPGRSGCSSRSTGPTPFPASRASVVKASDKTEVRFEVELKSGNPLQVTLTLDDDSVRREPTGERVSTERRRKLDMPESCCFPSSSPR
jgi:hypothetical protein